MEIVMNDTDLIIGAELLEDNIQMCVYDSELKAPVAADTEKDKTLSENIKAVINKKNASSVCVQPEEGTLSEWYSAYGLQCFGN